ncbi:DnaJ C-terminal domain-containing protein, partial [Candidatus Proelusimicrobium excrementi]|uniref:DnaJ C-terminal domain-containing protein n=1 Tax=Candidatus Proelusimicrobium excrementi TaxID=3416222 RepID=UPI003D139857
MTEQNMNKHIFPVPDPKKYLDVTTEIHFQRKNLPRGELVWIPVEGGKEQILIPLDIKDGDTIKVNGRGKYNSKTGEIGDLYVVVHIKGKEFSWKKILLLCAVVVAVISVVFFLFKKTSPPPIEPTETICFHDWLPADCTTPKTCSKCGGKGKIIRDKCYKCSGSGKVKVKKNILINIIEKLPIKDNN